MKVPPFLLRYQATIRPYLGAGANGPVYGPAFTAPCHATTSRRIIASRDGRKITTTASVRFQLGTDCPLESLVSVATRTGVPFISDCRVLTSVQHIGSGPGPTPDHLEITLS